MSGNDVPVRPSGRLTRRNAIELGGAGLLGHWPDCFTALLAGGGIPGGAIYGASEKVGAFPVSDPVAPDDLAATIFTLFGVSPHSEIHDPAGRPYRVAEGRPIGELLA